MDVAVTHVEVESDGAHGLLVRWELRGDGPVDIAVGPTPEAVDHRHAVRGEAGQRAAHLTHVGRGRHYVSVAPHGGGGAVVAAERRLPFAGLTNFRDLGGYPTASGGRTRWGRVFRSDALHRLTAEDLADVGRLGIRTVVDLRHDRERQLFPNVVTCSQRQLALLAPLPDEPDPRTLVRAVDGEGRLRVQYLALLAGAAPLFGQVLSHLVEPEALPAVFHCAAGKDRTGMVAALLLTWLGVDRETVLDDYELSARWRTPDNEREFTTELRAAGMGEEAILGLLGAPRWAMADALAALDAEHGGIEAYLRGPAGMDAEVLDRLRRTLIADP